MFVYLYNMIQIIIIGGLMLASLYYLGRLVHKSLKGDASCGGGCAKCAVTETKSIPVK